MKAAFLRSLAVLFALLICSRGLQAHSVLTHEEIVDLLWTDEIRPILLKRYPTLTEDQIREAHAYAYGGAVIQDLGYYPLAAWSSAIWCTTSGPVTSSASC